MKTPCLLPQYPEHIASLKPYVSGSPISDRARRLNLAPERIAQLASNENPLGASPRALAALADAKIEVSRYPDSDCTDLLYALSELHGVPPEWIVVGAGSESLLGNAVVTLLSINSTTAYSQYSFQAYVNAAQRVGAKHLVIPSPEFTVDLNGLERAADLNPSLIYIANPGNPTGTCLEPDALAAFLNHIPQHIVVLLDEAYFEFLPARLQPDSMALVKAHQNLLVTRTFSKAYGLAGLRIGYGVAQPMLAEMLRRLRPPFTVTESAQLAATAALQDQEFLFRTLENNERCKQALVEGLNRRGVRCLNGHTNFVLAEVGDGVRWAGDMERHGVFVRPVNSYSLPDWVRISIGRAEDIQRLLNAMGDG